MRIQFRNAVATGALVALTGFILSGPVAVLLVRWLHPQPEWASAEVFVANYHPVQHSPYFLGFILLTGLMIMIAGHDQKANRDDAGARVPFILAVGFGTVFCALILFNYIVQVSFIHNLVVHYRPEYDMLISGFSMSNPDSISWALEMWGYAVLGFSLLFLLSWYREHVWIRILIISNFILSLISAISVCFDNSWLLTPTGLYLFFFWNLLMIVLLAGIYSIHRTKKKSMVTLDM